MTKTDRIAIVVSGLYFLFLLFAFFERVPPQGLIIFSLPMVLYWAYRFIKNDISFLKMKYEDK